jgi:hypothetical protein
MRKLMVGIAMAFAFVLAMASAAGPAADVLGGIPGCC